MNHWLTKGAAVAGALAVMFVMGMSLWGHAPRLFWLVALIFAVSGGCFRTGLDWRCRTRCSRWCLALAGGTARWTGDRR